MFAKQSQKFASSYVSPPYNTVVSQENAVRKRTRTEEPKSDGQNKSVAENDQKQPAADVVREIDHVGTKIPIQDPRRNITTSISLSCLPAAKFTGFRKLEGAHLFFSILNRLLIEQRATRPGFVCDPSAIHTFHTNQSWLPGF
jgi:hypothetical protein